ncbi:MAG: M67 family metallopeptidase [Novosphingobium sp.]
MMHEMGTDLAVTSGAIATVLNEAARAHPQEACGLLLGCGGVIELALPAGNVAADPLRHFEIDPAALIAAHRAARGGGRQVLGYYHSHPNGLDRPSATDSEQAGGDGLVWAIAAGGKVSFWRDVAGGFAALDVRLVE